MVSKKILGVAIAAALSAPAFAAIDMGTVTFPAPGTAVAGSGAVTIAKESVTTAQVVGGLVQFTNATAADTAMDLGFGVSAGSHAFVRIDLTNGKFLANLSAASLTLTGKVSGGAGDYVVQLAQGGAAGDSYVIFDVTAVTALTQTQELVLDLTGLQVSPTAATTISFAHYATSPNAVAQSGALATDSYAAVSVTNVLSATITATDRVASVNSTPVFTQFVSPASATASLGTFKMDIAAGAVDAAGVAVTALAQVIDTGAVKSTLTVTGDLSYTLGATAGATAANLTFGTVASNTAATNVPSAKLDNFSTLPFVAGVTYSVEVTATSAINAGAYSLAATFSPIATAAYGPSNASGALGNVTREGTTIQVPYLTTFTDYNQRLVLVNRGTTAVPYSISFTEEAGVTATAGSAATGTLAANETKIIKATDIVTLSGATRTAATVVVTAPSSTIDAATTSVNLSDKSTDTVKLN